jgi:hypothetical protein
MDEHEPAAGARQGVPGGEGVNLSMNLSVKLGVKSVA